MSRRLLLRLGFFVGGLLLLPALPILGLFLFEGSSNATSGGGFGADVRLVYLMILGGPLIALGLIVMTITSGIWLFTLRSKKETD